VRDVGAELRNIERQRETTNRIVNEIDGQIGGLNTSLEQVSAELVLAEDNLAEKRAVLDRRLVEIYKRGPLYTFQALLAAESFGNLLARYKYLFLSSNQDRQLVSDVEALRNRVGRQRRELLGIRTSLDLTRAEREAELRRYSSLASARERRLNELRRSGRVTSERITALERDEARLNELLAYWSVRAGRPRAGRHGRAGALSAADIGRLDWPVDGRVIWLRPDDAASGGSCAGTA
jgi:septal ring factor EnvC (AmiA/AmiB activator)